MTKKTIVTLRHVYCSALLLAGLGGVGCGPSEGGPPSSMIPMGPTGPTGPAERCGDGRIGGAELCDGAELGGASCAGLGLGGGSLACAPGCAALDTSGCSPSCVPDCTGRNCGPDPTCGVSCGECAEGFCGGDGLCPEEPRVPIILSFTTTTSEYRGRGELTFTASVSDPNNDLLGGVLQAPNGQSMGPFLPLATPGAYSIGVDFAEMNAGEPLFSGPQGVRRWFKAEFSDAEGNRASTGLINMVVRCPADEDSFCDGSCLNLGEDVNNCGQCGKRCDALNLTEPLVWDGRCYAYGCMVPVTETPPSVETCNSMCLRRHLFCVPSPDPGSTTPTAGEASYSCGATQPLAGCDDAAPELAPGGEPDCALQSLRCSCAR